MGNFTGASSSVKNQTPKIASIPEKKSDSDTGTENLYDLNPFLGLSKDRKYNAMLGY